MRGQAIPMDSWGESIDSFLAWLVAGGASVATVKLRRCYLRQLARHFPAGPWTLRPDDLALFLARPSWTLETRRAVRSSVRGFYGWAELTDRVPRSPARTLPPVRVPRPLPRPTPAEVIDAALARAGRRDRLMLLLALLAGLRRSEIAQLRGEDVIAYGAGPALRVRGKGGRVRVVPLHPALAAKLPETPGPVFPGRDHGHLSPHRVGIVLARLLGPGWSGHTLRHRFATNCYAFEHDLRAVQELLGHASVTTTQVYTAVPHESLRAAVLSLTA